MTPAPLFDLSGRTALVTGPRTGIGRAAAEALAAAGADIAGLGSSPMPETAARVRDLGRSFHEIRMDLARTQPDELRRVAEDVHADILVNNAGIIRRADVLSFSEEDWDSVMTVNLKNLFFLSQAVAGDMVLRKSGGRIVNIASLLSQQGGIRVPSYAASKHGVTGITRAMANELAPYGITVNAIAPGYFETDNTQALRDDAARAKEILSRIPAGRWGRPDDIAGAVVFLASAASAYVTGSIVTVDGGWMAR